jgi:hypothetical protein
MSTLALRAETLKLARLLGTPAAPLEFLHQLAPDELRLLRRQCSDALYDTEGDRLERLAYAARLLPAPLLARLAEKFFGPLLCARLAGYLPPDRALQIALRLPIPFLAQVCLQLDPRRTQALVRAIPIPQVVEISRELARLREHVTMAHFVDSLDLAAVLATAAALDDETLLRVGFFVEDAARLSAVVASLPPARLAGIVRHAIQTAPELWPEALSLIAAIAGPQRRRIARLAADFEEDLLVRMVERTQQLALWPAMLALLAEMDEPALSRVVQLPVLRTPGVRQALAETAATDEVWLRLAPLFQGMEPGAARVLLAAADELAPPLGSRLAAGFAAAG